MIDAYYDYQWHLTLDPLYEKFQHWKAGETSHDEMDEAIHKLTNPARMFTTCSQQNAIC